MSANDLEEPVRSTHCSHCPFKWPMRLEQLTGALENYPEHDPACDVLCHEGLEMNEPDARCRGFRDNALRLGLIHA